MAGTSNQATLPLVNQINAYNASQDAYFMVLTPPPPFTTGFVTSGLVTSGPVTSASVTSAPVTSSPMTSAPMTSAPITTFPVTSSVVTSGFVTSGVVTTQEATTQGVLLVTTSQVPITSGIPTSDSQKSEGQSSIEEGKGFLGENMMAVIGGSIGGFLLLILVVIILVVISVKKRRQRNGKVERLPSQNDLELKGRSFIFSHDY